MGNADTAKILDNDCDSVELCHKLTFFKHAKDVIGPHTVSIWYCEFLHSRYQDELVYTLLSTDIVTHYVRI